MAHSQERHPYHSMAEGASDDDRMKATQRASIKRIMRELEDVQADPHKQCTAGLIDPTNPYHWNAVILGPEGSPYEGGLFHLRIQLPRHYPLGAPKVNFLTTIYHPNISTTDGEVHMDLLKWKWSPSLSVGKVLASIHSLMCNPNLDTTVEYGIAAEYKNNREHFIWNAKLSTMAFAKE
nr:ubiquitin-conjugating enzyme E2 D4-like [Rhipicephalus microplus]